MISSIYRPAGTARRPLAMALAVAASTSAFGQAVQTKKLEPVVVTATRTPQIAGEVLSDNVVITSEEIAQSGQVSLVDMLQARRGIEISRNGGPGTNSSVFIRGTANNQNIVLVDGVRVGSATTGGASWAAIPLSQIDHVEIVYGPLSSLYGADAMGGVVQIFTRKGEGKPAPAISAGVGSYNTRNLEAGISGATAGERKFRYALNAAHETSDGFSATKAGAFGFNPDKDGYTSDNASGQFSLELAKDQEIGLSLLHNHLNAQFDNSRIFDDRNVQTLDTIALHAKNRITSSWLSTVQLSQSDDKLASITASGRNFFDTRQTGLSWQNDVSIGKDVLQMVLERREEKADTSNAAVNRTRTTNSVAAAYQLRRGAHLATASVRNDDSSQTGATTTGSLAYGYRMTNALRANASLGTSFRAPTFNELFFPGYGIASNRPEKGRDMEAGLYHDDGKSQFSAVYYHNRITDLLVTAFPCPVDPATHQFGCAYNVNKALLSGVTFGASTTLGNYLMHGSLDLQDPHDETTGRQLARRARHHGTVGVDYHAGSVRAGSELVFASRRYDDAANRNVLGGYTLVNLHASYDFAPDWSLFGRWDNVFDKKYELVRNYATAGSSLFIGVRYAMK
ncbi:MAG TPA: TonB-dependent receptor [Noviherbaspirillum sp.]|uniref:TonB-dependent receptor domain-containing protein n=1 Tax=Noviherbaspirillum sp. TaxID=1926288 RepID=UPI002B463C41|nr:TonB-dependent receptor [Noviherbaspirillum sp.]HJV84605.1 TonB-dependent receptor [Noviherbaspirillum sp.]